MARTYRLLPLLLAACGASEPPIAPEVDDPLGYVDPRIGTGGLGFAYGSCFVGAAAPNGLVKVAPDTSGPFGTVDFLHFSGYFADDDRIRGFSHLHLHGAGATDYGVLSVMPVSAFDAAKTSVVDYETRFAKADEHPAAGRYEVTLANGIAVELTATPHVAVHRVRNAGALVIDLAKVLASGEVDDASITVDASRHELAGELHHLGGMSDGFGGYRVYFVARSRAAWTSHVVWAAGMPPTAADSARGTKVGAALSFTGDIELAVGVSLVSAAGARANLDAEVPAVDFEAAAAATRAAWQSVLATALVTGGSEQDRRVFYTSLYHAFLMPSVISDVDGTYQLAGQPPATATGWRQLSDLSLWDTYRTVVPLYGWLAPTVARDTARSLVAFGDGLGIHPRWPIAIGEAGTMLGASAEIAIADVVARGIDGVAAERAWPLLRAAAIDPTPPPAGRGPRDQVEPYIMLGYVPSSVGRSVSHTTEYSHDDFALAQLAGTLGFAADRDALLARSHNWRALMDDRVGFLRGRDAAGDFAALDSFDPFELSDDYAEANAWHSLWMVGAHDPDGLAGALGGESAAIAKLEEFFAGAKRDRETADPAAANFPRPYYWHGNEPDMNAAYLFTQWGRRELTEQWVGWIERELYGDGADGVAGNDDGGTLGAWYVLSALGFYPIPGSDQWIVGAPRFPMTRVVVDGRELVIRRVGNGARVRDVIVDGAPLSAPTVTHATLKAATAIDFVTE